MWLWVTFALLCLLVLLYNVSQTCHYFIRISSFYICIFLHAIDSTILMIPSYLQGGGADPIFTWFYYWSRWTGVNVEMRGFEEHLKDLKTPAVVVCNHQSAIDVVAMTYVWPPRGIVMMKKSLMYIPFFNFTSYLANSIFVDRFNRDKALQSVDHCVDALTTKNLKLWVFPEGTRFKGKGMLPFKKGAFNIAVRAQIPVIPVVLSHYGPFYSKADRMFRNDGEVIAEVLPAVTTEGLTLDDVTPLADRVREQMMSVYERISEEAAEKMRRKRAGKTE